MLRLIFLVKPPFFYAAPVAKTTFQPSASLVHRFIAWGEQTWHQWGSQPAGTVKHGIHALSLRLINRLGWEERSLWRCYAAFHHHRQAFPITIQTDTTEWRRALVERLEKAIWRHRVGRAVYAVALIPVTLLTVLPFVKAVWAWCMFRLIARHRALHGALWLRSSLATIQRDHTPIPVRPNALNFGQQLDEHFKH